MPMMLYKLDDDYEIWSEVGSHDHDIPLFGIVNNSNYHYDECYTYIRLDKPEYYNDYHPHIPSKVVKKLAIAMNEVIKIKDGDFIMEGTLWNILVWLWNNGPEYYSCRDDKYKIKSEKANMPNYAKLAKR